MHSVLKKEYFLSSSEDDDDPIQSSQAEYLLVNESGIYGVYSQRFVQKYRKFYAFGSGASYALGAMHALDCEGASAREVVEKAISAAAEFDDGTAAPFQFRQIRKAAPLESSLRL